MPKGVAKNRKFFKSLTANLNDEVKVIVERRVDAMLFTLRIRAWLGKSINGRTPKWVPPPNPPSKKSHLRWETLGSVEKKNKVSFELTNKSTPRKGNFKYAEKLATGWTHVNPSWKITKLVLHNGKYFSTQMPFGLQPFVDLNKLKVKSEIKSLVKGKFK